MYERNHLKIKFQKKNVSQNRLYPMKLSTKKRCKAYYYPQIFKMLNLITVVMSQGISANRCHFSLTFTAKIMKKTVIIRKRLCWNFCWSKKCTFRPFLKWESEILWCDKTKIKNMNALSQILRNEKCNYSKILFTNAFNVFFLRIMFS